MQNNTFTQFLADHIDYSVPDFFEVATYCFYGGLFGSFLAVVLYLVVVAL